MKKKLIIVLAALFLLNGCQQTNEISEIEATPIEIEASKDETLETEAEAVSEEMADVLEDAVIEEVHEWTAADQEKLDAFKEEAETLDMVALKGLVDDKMSDTSSMMADEYVAYYEERLIKGLGPMSDLFFTGSVQEDLIEAFDYGYFTKELVSQVENEETIKKIEDLYAVGYKVETSEGMYYPIIDYNILYRYEDKVTSGVQLYLRLMKRQSDIMAYSDAAVIVPWSELGERLLMAEELQNVHLPEPMKERAFQEYQWGFLSFVFGTNNTPVFNFENKEVDEDVRIAFKDIAERGGDQIKAVMVPYIEVLEEDNYIGTDKVYETVNALLQEYIQIQ